MVETLRKHEAGHAFAITPMRFLVGTFLVVTG
jgi:hypothetical protein